MQWSSDMDFFGPPLEESELFKSKVSRNVKTKTTTPSNRMKIFGEFFEELCTNNGGSSSTRSDRMSTLTRNTLFNVPSIGIDEGDNPDNHNKSSSFTSKVGSLSNISCLLNNLCNVIYFKPLDTWSFLLSSRSYTRPEEILKFLLVKFCHEFDRNKDIPDARDYVLESFECFEGYEHMQMNKKKTGRFSNHVDVPKNKNIDKNIEYKPEDCVDFCHRIGVLLFLEVWLRSFPEDLLPDDLAGFCLRNPAVESVVSSSSNNSNKKKTLDPLDVLVTLLRFIRSESNIVELMQIPQYLNVFVNVYRLMNVIKMFDEEEKQAQKYKDEGEEDKKVDDKESLKEINNPDQNHLRIPATLEAAMAARRCVRIRSSESKTYTGETSDYTRSNTSVDGKGVWMWKAPLSPFVDALLHDLSSNDDGMPVKHELRQIITLHLGEINVITLEPMMQKYSDLVANLATTELSKLPDTSSVYLTPRTRLCNTAVDKMFLSSPPKVKPRAFIDKLTASPMVERKNENENDSDSESEFMDIKEVSSSSLSSSSPSTSMVIDDRASDVFTRVRQRDSLSRPFELRRMRTAMKIHKIEVPGRGYGSESSGRNSSIESQSSSLFGSDGDSIDNIGTPISNVATRSRLALMREDRTLSQEEEISNASSRLSLAQQEQSIQLDGKKIAKERWKPGTYFRRAMGKFKEMREKRRTKKITDAESKDVVWETRSDALSLLLDFHASDIAHTLTIRLHYLYCCIPISEFIVNPSFNYTSTVDMNKQGASAEAGGATGVGTYDSPENSTPFLQRIRRESERLQNLLVWGVLRYDDIALRAEAMMQLIAVGEELARLHSHHALMIVVSSLRCQALYRLRVTRSVVERYLPGRWSNLGAIVGMSGTNLVNKLLQEVGVHVPGSLSEELEAIVHLPDQLYVKNVVGNAYDKVKETDSVQEIEKKVLTEKKEEMEEVEDIVSELLEKKRNIVGDEHKEGEEAEAEAEESIEESELDLSAVLIPSETDEEVEVEEEKEVNIQENSELEKTNIHIQNSMQEQITRSDIQTFSDKMMTDVDDSTDASFSTLSARLGSLVELLQLRYDHSSSSFYVLNDNVNETNTPVPTHRNSGNLDGYVEFRQSSLSIEAELDEGGVPPCMPYINGFIQKLMRLNELPDVLPLDSICARESLTHNANNDGHQPSSEFGINTTKMHKIASLILVLRSCQLQPYPKANRPNPNILNLLLQETPVKTEDEYWARSKALEQVIN